MSQAESPIHQILGYARWAPSGDNVQNWQFEVLNDHQAIIHGRDESDWLVYDKQGNASKLALGCLLETFDIAAQQLGYATQILPVANKFDIQPDEDDYASNPTFKVTLTQSTAKAHSLFAAIKTRTVQRKWMGRYALSADEKSSLESILPEGYSVIWLESGHEKKQIASLMYGNATTRYLMKEGYETHSRIIEFTPINKDQSEDKLCNNQLSKTKLPAKALGIDPFTVAIMEWVLASWERFHFVSTYLAGTVWPKLIMDYMTAICCSSHFLIVADKEPSSLQDYVAAGRAVQRFWLQTAQLQLGFQPEQTPIIFSEFLRNQVNFTTNQKAIQNAQKMDHKIKALLGDEVVSKAIFMGRVGRTTPPKYRSVRKSLEELTQK